MFGFLLGGLCWFAIPFAFASTTGLGYIALSAQQDFPLLDDDSVDAGTNLESIYYIMHCSINDKDFQTHNGMMSVVIV